MLQIQYQIYKKFNDDANHVIYDDHFISNSFIENRSFLQSLLILMFFNFEYNDKFFRIRFYLHFVNVKNDEKIIVDRNKYNVAKIDVIVTMIIVMKTKNSNMFFNNIVIIIDYVMQYFKIKTCLIFHHQRNSTRKWNQIRIFIFEIVQNDEFEIIMLTLIRTTNSRNFLNNKKKTFASHLFVKSCIISTNERIEIR